MKQERDWQQIFDDARLIFIIVILILLAIISLTEVKPQVKEKYQEYKNDKIEMGMDTLQNVQEIQQL